MTPPVFVTAVIKIWLEGYSIDDGPHCEFDKYFLKQLSQGKVPDELKLLGITSLIYEFHRKERFPYVPTEEEIEYMVALMMNE